MSDQQPRRWHKAINSSSYRRMFPDGSRAYVYFERNRFSLRLYNKLMDSLAVMMLDAPNIETALIEADNKLLGFINADGGLHGKRKGT